MHGKHGKGYKICRRCRNHRGVINKYGLAYCRRCFREVADGIGFHKYN